MASSGSGGPSNFGCFRSGVGSKAGGFIAKKFFHPSSIRNQQRVWEGMEKAKEKEKIEEERQKRREEERRVDELRREMRMRGQGKKEDDIFKRSLQTTAATGEEAEAQKEYRKRLKMLEKLDEEAARKTKSTILSKYKENVHPRSHTTVWGSLYDGETKRWGYKCCGVLEKKARCPLAEEEGESASKAKGRKRAREDNVNVDSEEEAEKREEARVQRTTLLKRMQEKKQEERKRLKTEPPCASTDPNASSYVESLFADPCA